MRMGIIAATILLSTFGAVRAEVAFQSAPQAISAARDAIKLHYITRNIYYPVVCPHLTEGNDTFVKCHDGSGIGGLFLIQVHGSTPTIYIVNGKAKTHLRGYTKLLSADQKPIAVEPWNGQAIDIPKINAQMRP
ncbi:hypothetical protein GCM10007301_15530 [Azorhizobium oxalatiphilum]|uniref:Uncharacterized protein n=1 Tax=Azorhizobium oxalatiphilum TaxID=980631 RepID=A0A917BUF8_9HYPH|nr:hypothetical protein [Azorhizobium oxalatiphilum]GGF56742.1 hypothetical protein GCM10007301_15530 [Azorhizobium oxalatiphilum]